ncbi:hypothetical protein AB0C59_07640 [Streptomyces sp. NPDC048664]|uniref:hypothetical protein n=1 Tax=Streptomyces sp. NPDC048664 TaxID=3154505 RepID=UPI0034425E0C
MSEFAGLNPHRVRLLADKLQALADTLARESPNIQKLFGQWGGTLNQGMLTRQVTQVHDDARDMAKRADEALTLLHGPRLVDPNDPHKDMINVPWDVSKINTTYEAQQEAQYLKSAMDDPDDPASRETINEISQSLSDHKDDAAYLQAFMANGGMTQAARAARILHGQDGTHDGEVLSKESQQIVARFSQGVQAATSLAQAGRITLPANAVDALTKPQGGDMWSVGMLFKYGPDGDKWDPNVLSAVGGAMLDWRQKNEMRPDYEKDPNGFVGSYVGADDAWYKSLGIDVDYRHGGTPMDHARDIAAIDANDPSIALMQRVSENADASRLLVTGKEGPQHAAALVSDKWATPGPDSFDDAKFPAAVIRAATLDRQHHPDASAEAAANLINAGTAEYNKEKTKDDYDREQYPVNKGITKALSTVFQAYVPDFADSSGTPGMSAYAKNGVITVGHDQARDFLSEIMQNKDEAGNVMQAIDAQISLSAQSGLDDKSNTGRLSDFAELRGTAFAAGKAVKLDADALVDAENTQRLLWFNIVASGAAAIPNPTSSILPNAIQAAIWAGIPYGDSKFTTNTQATDAAAFAHEGYDQAAFMSVPIVQGLLRAHKIAPPPEHPEWADGNIQFRKDTNDAKDFYAWWSHDVKQRWGYLPDHVDQDMANSFNRGNL